MHGEDARYSIQLLAHQIETDNHRTHKSSSEASVAVLKAGLSVIRWEILKTHTSEDAVLVKVMEQVGKGFPDSSYQVHPSVQPYHKYRNQLSTIDGVLCFKTRVVIPTELRQHVLQTLHSAHQGVTSMTNRAEQAVFWPGISTDI